MIGVTIAPDEHFTCPMLLAGVWEGIQVICSAAACRSPSTRLAIMFQTLAFSDTSKKLLGPSFAMHVAAFAINFCVQILRV